MQTFSTQVCNIFAIRIGLTRESFQTTSLAISGRLFADAGSHKHCTKSLMSLSGCQLKNTLRTTESQPSSLLVNCRSGNGHCSSSQIESVSVACAYENLST